MGGALHGQAIPGKWRRVSRRLATVALLGLGLMAGTSGVGAQTPNQDDADPVVYTSPMYGYTLTYDPADWVIVNGDPDTGDEYDSVTLSTGTSLVTLIGDPDYFPPGSDPEEELGRCVDDYAGAIMESADVTDAETRSYVMDEDGRSGMIVVYTYDEEEWAEIIVCTALPDGITAVMLRDAPTTDSGQTETELWNELRDGIAPAD
jgi:hypothetical protein